MLLLITVARANGKQMDATISATSLLPGTHLSKVVFVVCRTAATTFACCDKRLVWYSCSDDGGDLSFEMTQASKKFPLDSHSDSSFDSFILCSSFAATMRGYDGRAYIACFAVRRYSPSMLTDLCIAEHRYHRAFQAFLQFFGVFPDAEKGDTKCASSYFSPSDGRFLNKGDSGWCC